ncbi:MAG: prepilin-type N-terminal cleavage/methylation domain-containing protein [bacterium]|nr:prepilin-type N-terminal cleavage/methylation domain-containing protein [bacterium]
MKNGFTLIEIMVVIGIIVIMSSVSWVGFKNYQPSMALSVASRDLTTDLRLAQQLSITEQINHGIFFNTSTNEYQLKKFSTTTAILLTKKLPTDIIFCAITGLSGAQAVFNPYGSVAYSGSVCLVNNKGQTKTIDIKPSGFVKIQD